MLEKKQRQQSLDTFLVKKILGISWVFAHLTSELLEYIHEENTHTGRKIKFSTHSQILQTKIKITPRGSKFFHLREAPDFR